MTDTHVVAVHDDHSGDIHIYQREWDGDVPGEKRDIGPIKFDWYFLIKLEDEPKLATSGYRDLIDRTEREGDFLRVYCQNRNYNKWKRDDGQTDAKMVIVRDLVEMGVTTYEADLTSYQRYMIDNDVQMGGKFRVLYYDIETDDRGAGIDIGRDQIISYAAYDPLAKKTYYKSTDNEAGLIKGLLTLFEKYDVIIGWNSDGFDLPYIRKRAQKYDLQQYLYRIMGVQTLDMLVKFQETYGRDTAMIKQFRSFKLDDIAKYFLGEGKIERGSTWDMYQNDPEALKKYNIRDVVILSELEEKTGIVAMSIIKAQICGARLNEKTSGRVLDNYILRAANKKQVHYRSVVNNVINMPDDLDTTSYAGGHVFTPVLGRHPKVHLFDFSSLYPSIIRTFNVSPETIKGYWNSGLDEPEGDGPFDYIDDPEPIGDDIGTPVNIRYEGEKGVIPALIHDLVVIRNQMRKVEMKKYDHDSFEYQNLDKKQYVYKVLANSMYGILGAPFFRYYDREIAESITRTGHFLTKTAAEFARRKGHTVVYGDTDSIFVAFGNEVQTPEEFGAELKDFFEVKLAEWFNVRESYIVMDYKDTFTNFLITGKKKYVAIASDGSLELTGFEVIKRDTVKYGADMQRALFAKIIEADTPVDQIKEWLSEHRKHILEGDVALEDITMYKKLTKNPKEFANFKKGGKLPIHAQIYLDAKDRVKGGLEVGAYIPFIVTVEKPQSGVHPIDYAGEFSRSYYWNTRIYALLQRVLEVAFPDEDWKEFEYVDPIKAEKKRLAAERKKAKAGKKPRRVKTVKLDSDIDVPSKQGKLF